MAFSLVLPASLGITMLIPLARPGRGLFAATFFFWLAGGNLAYGQLPLLLAEKGWAVGYILVALCILMGLLAVCIPRLRRIELKEEEPEQQSAAAAKGQAPGPASPYGQYGQFGQPGYGQPGYGQPQRPAPHAAPRGGGGGAVKSRKVAGLLGIFLGGWGVHRFYLGYTGIGAAMILVTLVTCGAGAWWGLIDGIMILAGSGVNTDAEGNPLGP